MSDKLKAFIESYSGTFPFLLSIKSQWLRTGSLSERQIMSVQKCMGRVNPAVSASIPSGSVLILKKAAAFRIGEAAGLNIPYYAVEVINGHAETEKALLLTVRLSGTRTTYCGACGAFLSDAVSVESGIGPVCAEKMGIKQDRNALEALRQKLSVTRDVKQWIPKSVIKERFINV